LLPQLHTKLGLRKNIINIMNEHGKGFEYLREISKTRWCKIKRASLLDCKFMESLRMIYLYTCWWKTEKSAWLTFKAVCLNFLEDVKAENYRKFDDWLNAY
jgi:hypothetical protein